MLFFPLIVLLVNAHVSCHTQMRFDLLLLNSTSCHFVKCANLGALQGWVILRDTASLLEIARALATRLKWDARVIKIESNSVERLLICQKPFFKKQANQLRTLEGSVNRQIIIFKFILRIEKLSTIKCSATRWGNEKFWSEKMQRAERNKSSYAKPITQCLWSRKAYIGPCNYTI